jgi:hypothetical protein
MDEQIKALLSMGYRKMNLLISREVYGKPVGYHLFVFYPNEQTIFNYCLGNNPETQNILIYNSAKYPDPSFETFLGFLKEFEANSVTYINNGSKFEFLTVVGNLGETHNDKSKQQ